MCAFPLLRFGTERLYAQKEDLLHEVLELEAEKGLIVSNDGTKYQVSSIIIVSAEREEHVYVYYNASVKNAFFNKV